MPYLLLFLSLLMAGFCGAAAADLRGCSTRYFEKYYGAPHRLAAIEGAPYALLANNVYDAKDTPRFVLPAALQAQEFAFDTGDSDMAFALYVYRRPALPETLVLVFRGTDSGRDWWSGTIRGEQYALALKLAQAVRAKFPHSRLSVTGHSLGGGLALHVSMAMQGVAAYAFNPSPLTRAPQKPQHNRRVIFWEENDLLHYPRWAMDKSPDTSYWKFSFVHENGHNSVAMAKGLLMVAAIWNPEYADLLQKNCSVQP